MKNSYFKSYGRSVILFFTAFLLFFACKEDNPTNPEASKPEMPPIVSIQMDFNSFPESTSLDKITGNNGSNNIENNGNWGWAWLHGVGWKTLVEAGMSIPFVAFAESFNHEAEQQEDGSWLWQYSFQPLGGVSHTASLYANVNNNGVNWEMHISKSSYFEDFLWFSGTSNLFGTEGTWTFYTEPNDPKPWLGIEWEHNKDDSTGNIKYTNINTESDENGGYILYGVVSDPIYDAFFEIYDKKKDNLVSIKWNRDTHEGTIKDSKHFNDEEWHCWNSALENIDCN